MTRDPLDAIGALDRVTAELLDDPDEARQLIGEYLAAERDRVLRTLLDDGDGAVGRRALDSAVLPARDALLREAAAIVGPRRLAAVLRNYHATSWPRDRVRSSPPEDRLKSLLWRVLKLRDASVGERQLQRIIGRAVNRI